MKKVLTVLLAVVLLLTTIPAIADDDVLTSGNFQYTIKGNGTATIVGYTGEHADIVLPNLIDGYTITTIGANAFSCEKKQSQGISVTLPATVTAIEEMAFRNRNVRSINLPDSLEYIGYGAFAGCAGEIQFRISNNHPYFATIDGSLYNKSRKEILTWCYIETSESSAKIPEGITSVGSYSFSQMDGTNGKYYGLSFIDFPSTISSIGEGAFKDAKNIKVSFHLDSNVRKLPNWAFGCESGNEVQIDSLPKGVKSIGDFAFLYAELAPDTWKDAITFDVFLQEVESIGKYAFSNCAIDGYSDVIITIPDTCIIVEEGAFYNVQSPIVEISLANGIEQIESKAFQMEERLTNYTSVYLPESLTYIANDAFNVGMEFVVEKGSYAERWAKENAYPYTINGEEQNLDWLNN